MLVSFDHVVLNLTFNSLQIGGEEEVSLCVGDGGAPLVCSATSSPKNFYQAGILVGGVGCGVKDVPSLFVNVSKYRDWIEAKFLQLGLNNSSHVL